MKRVVVALLLVSMLVLGSQPYAVAQKSQKPQVQTPGQFRADPQPAT